jgi:hypothetical protein
MHFQASHSAKLNAKLKGIQLLIWSWAKKINLIVQLSQESSAKEGILEG